MVNHRGKYFGLGGVLVFFLLASLNLHADEKSGITLYPAVGYYNFLTREDTIDDSHLLSIAVGYQLNNRWSTELTYLGVDTDRSGVDIEMRQTRFDALYLLEQEGKIQPFMSVGLGENKFDGANYHLDETIISLGTGIKYAITDRISWRTDLRLPIVLDENEFDFSVATGIDFFFGRTSSTRKKTVTQKRKDSDRDGVIDALDHCPNTPKAVEVDTKGCPLDSDNDGVPNVKDQCPDSAVGSKVDQNGCYIVLSEKKEVNLEVKFANNSNVVEQVYFAEIKQVADFMTQYPLTKVVVEGHTDDRGSAAYNETLSKKRAKAVAQVLISQFNIDATRVSSIGYGEAKPVTSNDTAQGRALNRRVVAVVSAQVESVQK